jgi:hypothetical protein
MISETTKCFCGQSLLEWYTFVFIRLYMACSSQTFSTRCCHHRLCLSIGEFLSPVCLWVWEYKTWQKNSQAPEQEREVGLDYVKLATFPCCQYQELPTKSVIYSSFWKSSGPALHRLWWREWPGRVTHRPWQDPHRLSIITWDGCSPHETEEVDTRRRNEWLRPIPLNRGQVHRAFAAQRRLEKQKARNRMGKGLWSWSRGEPLRVHWQSQRRTSGPSASEAVTSLAGYHVNSKWLPQ